MPNNLRLPTVRVPKGLQKGIEMIKRVKVPESVRQKIASVKLPEMQQWRERTREFVGRRGTRAKTTEYPFLVFHGVRSVQLLSSIIVMSVMSSFMSSLRIDGFSIPWTFILLLTVSIFTVLTLTATIVMHCYYGLNPKLNSALNGGLLLLWSLGFILLSWWTSNTLGHICTIDRWSTATGVTICRTYKALFSFTLFGLLSTIAATLLDLYVFRRMKANGKYAQMTDLPTLDHKPTALPDPSSFPEHHDQEMQPPKSPFEPMRSKSGSRPGSIKEVPTKDSAVEESPYDVFKPDVVVPAPKSRMSSMSSSKRPSREGYEPLETENLEDTVERVPHAETRP